MCLSVNPLWASSMCCVYTAACAAAADAAAVSHSLSCNIKQKRTMCLDMYAFS